MCNRRNIENLQEIVDEIESSDEIQLNYSQIVKLIEGYDEFLDFEDDEGITYLNNRNPNNQSYTNWCENNTQPSLSLESYSEEQAMYDCRCLVNQIKSNDSRHIIESHYDSREGTTRNLKLQIIEVISDQGLNLTSQQFQEDNYRISSDKEIEYYILTKIED